MTIMMSIKRMLILRMVIIIRTKNKISNNQNKKFEKNNHVNKMIKINNNSFHKTVKEMMETTKTKMDKENHKTKANNIMINKTQIIAKNDKSHQQNKELIVLIYPKERRNNPKISRSKLRAKKKSKINELNQQKYCVQLRDRYLTVKMTLYSNS